MNTTRLFVQISILALCLITSCSTRPVYGGDTTSNNVPSNHETGFTCRSICNGNYDICLGAIQSFSEKFICLAVAMSCVHKCKQDIGAFKEAKRSRNDITLPTRTSLSPLRYELNKIWKL